MGMDGAQAANRSAGRRRPDAGLGISPLVYTYVAYAAESWSGLVLRHRELHSV
jgi:hypothetical protein